MLKFFSVQKQTFFMISCERCDDITYWQWYEEQCISVIFIYSLSNRRSLRRKCLYHWRESVGTVQNRSSTYQPGLWKRIAKYNDIIIPPFKYSSPYSSFIWSSRASQRSLKFFPRLERMLVWNEPGSKILTFTPQGYISRLNASEKASTPYLATL